jgi:hypothetical protein
VSFWPVNMALRVAVAIAEIFVVTPLVIVFFPLSGGILYLIFWLATSRATPFLHQEGDEAVAKGDLRLVQLQARAPRGPHQRAAADQGARLLRPSCGLSSSASWYFWAYGWYSCASISRSIQSILNEEAGTSVNITKVPAYA